MSRSWLAKAKSIHDLGNNFYVPRSKSAYSWEREVEIEDKGLRQARPPLPVAAEYLPFFGAQMHDSRVMRVERTADFVRLRMDCDRAGIFAVGLSDQLGIDWVRRQWPVDLLFHQPVYMRAARYLPSAGLRFFDVRELWSDKPDQGPQFISDWFFQEDGRLQWIAEIDLMRWGRNPNLSSCAYLMVDCHRVSAVDRRLPALEAAFGQAVRPLWEDALAGIDAGSKPYGVWSAHTMEDFLQRRFAHHQLKRTDFEVS